MEPLTFNRGTIEHAVRNAEVPRLNSQKERLDFAARIAHLLTGHQDSEVQKLALMIETLIEAKNGKVRAMLDIELKESSTLKLLAMLASKEWAA